MFNKEEMNSPSIVLVRNTDFKLFTKKLHRVPLKRSAGCLFLSGDGLQ